LESRFYLLLHFNLLYNERFSGVARRMVVPPASARIMIWLVLFCFLAVFQEFKVDVLGGKIISLSGHQVIFINNQWYVDFCRTKMVVLESVF
jgi:hypothetical protein